MTDRTVIALLLSAITFVLTVIWGPPLIRVLRTLKVGDSIRLELPDSYLAKLGTPTMGGVMFIIPTILVTLVYNAVTLLGGKPAGRSVLLPLGTMLIFAFLGALDDWTKLRRKDVGEGMSIRYKFLVQLALSGVIGYGLYMVLDVPRLFIPTINFEIDLGWWHIPIAIFIILSEVNAVNFTDGMDGLAGLISATAFASFGAIAILQGQTYVAQFCFTLVGALFGFLWFNVHPAQLIMGDTGSMALGSALAVVALMTGQWLLLLVIGIIPLMEALSVVLQIAYFKRTGGKRIFKMAPIHLHFELSGWSETQVVQRFWLISLLAGLMGVALAVT
ncbi:phospho-N-acetylmuramoyl-pentapeptide-transferase [bacterium]|nr:phospho-N-acetylmuramoyl-pentapeptide-transferase [bacterium]MCB2179356.1 phospho-N-acetylmuramoyl-pentapeptide-transferase [bacterium]